MLELKDFFHLPQLDPFIEQLVNDEPGLVVVAGLDAPAPHTAGEDFLPSGRVAIFRILVRQILAGRSSEGRCAQTARRALCASTSTQAVSDPQDAVRGRCAIVAETKGAIRIPRQFGRQIEWALVRSPYTYAGRIASAAQRKPDLLVIDRLNAETVTAMLEAARSGLLVLSQLDTVFSGACVAYHLLDLGAPRELLDGLTWVITVHRLTKLCPDCKQAERPNPDRLAELRCRYPDLSLDGIFFRAAGCANCKHTGRQASVMAFDVFRAGKGFAGLSPSAPFGGQPSQLPVEEYILRLAMLGHVPLDDVFGFNTAQLHRTYNLLTTSQRALAESNAALERKLAQLEAANQVLQQRTEALISFQGISQTLATLTDVDDLAARVCRYTRDLCGADRAILYFLRPASCGCGQPDGAVEILAVNGWDAGLVHRRLDGATVMSAGGLAAASAEPVPFNAAPPGVLVNHLNVGRAALKAGLRVPLIAQHEVVGLMIVHTTQKSGFTPGEIALLQAFANQAAVALQRAGLIEVLRDKIAQLHAAQAELVKKERLERELELARQVQQSLLPCIFPLVPGYAFAARCEPARRVGGDFYDVVLLDADCFGLVIADVSDKGMPAALFMALTRSLLLAEARRERSPRAVLTSVHRLLLELGQPNMFVTVFYGVVDVITRQLTYTRAGHDRPLLLRKGSVHSLGGEGAFLGFLDTDELHLSEEQISLAPGDRLVLYTDGLIDALAAGGQPFGLSRLMSLLRPCASLPVDELCATTFADLAAYQGTAEQYDDMAMLVVGVE